MGIMLIPSFLNLFPRIFVIFMFSLKSACAALAPSVHITVGFIILIWLNRRRLVHAFVSFGRGFLLLGGRHFTVFVINTWSLVSPIASMTCVSSCPDLPTNGLPRLSS